MAVDSGEYEMQRLNQQDGQAPSQPGEQGINQPGGQGSVQQGEQGINQPGGQAPSQSGDHHILQNGRWRSAPVLFTTLYQFVVNMFLPVESEGNPGLCTTLHQFVVNIFLPGGSQAVKTTFAFRVSAPPNTTRGTRY